MGTESKAKTPSGPRFAVIGAGMSGLLTAIKLQEAGLDNFTIYEKADRLGGTWRDNRYPGLSCDVPSHLYRYSFESNPEWSHLFSPGAEICGYFDAVHKKYGLERFLRLETEISRCDYRDGKWRLTCQGGETDDVDFVICATGVLHHPVYPEIDGLGGFSGSAFHTARWPDGLSLKDKRIGIIGTGSTGIQIVPAIVDEVAKVSLFQRTAQWVFPLANPAYTDADKANFRHNPAVMAHIYKSMSAQIASTFSRAVIGDEEQMRLIAEACQANLDDHVKDPELKAKLTPDYQAACKRLIMSDIFYPAIQRDNAELVTAGIEQVEPAGVRTKDGRLHELDVLVLATGFNGHQFMRPMQVRGLDGLSLDEAWAETTEAYRSVALPGFPNFFMLVGPNSPIGNFSLIEISELQIGYIMQLIELYLGGKARQIMPRADATRRFNEAVRAAMGDTVWVSGCRSWYLDKNGNPAMWPWSFERFCAEMAAPDLNDFDLIA